MTAINSWRDCLLIAQERLEIEHGVLEDNRRWSLSRYEGLTKKATLRSIDCSLALAEVHRTIRIDLAISS